MRSIVALLFLASAALLPGSQRDEVQGIEARSEDSAYDLQCAYTARRDAPDLSPNQADFEWDHYEECARIDENGQLRVAPSHLRRMVLSDGFGDLLIEGSGWYYLTPEGRSLQVVIVDFGPDPWSEGLTRGWQDGGVVYFDRDFRPVTGIRYDFGWPYREGRALVCQGCEIVGPDRDHPRIAGGRWAFIDRFGVEFEEAELSDEQVRVLQRCQELGCLR